MSKIRIHTANDDRVSPYLSNPPRTLSELLAITPLVTFPNIAVDRNYGSDVHNRASGWLIYFYINADKYIQETGMNIGQIKSNVQTVIDEIPNDKYNYIQPILNVSSGVQDTLVSRNTPFTQLHLFTLDDNIKDKAIIIWCELDDGGNVVQWVPSPTSNINVDRCNMIYVYVAYKGQLFVGSALPLMTESSFLSIFSAKLSSADMVDYTPFVFKDITSINTYINKSSVGSVLSIYSQTYDLMVEIISMAHAKVHAKKESKSAQKVTVEGTVYTASCMTSY